MLLFQLTQKGEFRNHLIGGRKAGITENRTKALRAEWRRRSPAAASLLVVIQPLHDLFVWRWIFHSFLADHSSLDRPRRPVHPFYALCSSSQWEARLDSCLCDYGRHSDCCGVHLDREHHARHRTPSPAVADILPLLLPAALFKERMAQRSGIRRRVMTSTRSGTCGSALQ